MCVVIDANRAAEFCRQEHPYLVVLLKWLNSGGRIASGGHLEKELYRIEAMKGLLAEWSRAGRLVRIANDRIEAREKLVKPYCISDDPHVVALAIEARADVVVTADKNLIVDLRNKTLMGKKLRIYKESSGNPRRVDRHRSLLNASDCA